MKHSSTGQRIWSSVPELGGVRSFLDVGTGVGLLAIAAARAWPGAKVTAIDIWEPALRIAGENISAAGLADRISIRHQNVTDVSESEVYDCVWFPTFFVTDPVLDAAVPRLVRSLQHGGRLILGRMAPPPEPLAEAINTLKTVRGGGMGFDAKRLAAVLDEAGCVGIRMVPRQGPAPLEYVIGQRPER